MKETGGKKKEQTILRSSTH